MIEIELRFDGEEADDGRLEFYDAARALIGFQRSLALTTHLVLNGEIITQAPSLDGATIYIPAIEQGSWKTKALIVLGGAFAVGSVGKDSPVGHVVTSVYDYVLSETMGFHPDYDKTLQEQYHEHLMAQGITREKIDSLIEKTENAVADMHRPIVASETALRAEVLEGPRGERQLGPDLSAITYDYVRQTTRSSDTMSMRGKVTSYNVNTYKGRIFLFDERRPIPFELMPEARNRQQVGIITRSQHLNGQNRTDPRAIIEVDAFRLESVSGTLKRLHVIHVESAD